jgi:hypothetical protein
LIYADACRTAPYDGTIESLGEALIRKTDAGAIGYVGALRVTFYTGNNLDALNRGTTKLFWKVFFEDHTYQQGKTLYDSKMAYMNSDHYKYWSPPEWDKYERRQLLTYNLLGDPETDIYTKKPGVLTEEENPFPSTIYEGQMININIVDNFSRPVANPRVKLYNEEKGIARTVYGDETGNVKFRLPLGGGITYNVSISGHNLLGLSNFTFTTQADNDVPEINSAELCTENPSVSTNLHYQINTSDNCSGIESLFVLFSTDNFNNYFYHQITNEFDEDLSYFDFQTNKFEPGTYQYLVYTRDYTNKSSTMYESSFQIHIAIPITYYVLIGSVIGIGCVAVTFGVLYIRTIKLYPNKVRKLQRAQG